MVSSAGSGRRIAKNTILLYVRLLVTMCVALYTARVVLAVLGVEDYGVYNVVGGVVALFSFMSSSLNTATQRYMNYEMGRGDAVGLQKVFSMSLAGFALLAVAVCVLSEAVGLWLLHHKLVIPPGREWAAGWVFHFSVLTLLSGFLSAPYQAAIIAHERMSVYAYLSVGEAAAKLAAVFALRCSPADKLFTYGLLMFVVSLLVSACYAAYCTRLFPECRPRRVWDKGLFRGLFSFSGWVVVGTATWLLYVQGVNILLNVFFGSAVNAARAVAMQVYAAVNSFSVNFMTAVRPQLVQSYAAGDLGHAQRLVFGASHLSFYLLFVLSLPLLFNMEWALGLWLGTPPAGAVLFARLVLLDMLVCSFHIPLEYMAQASGRIRAYQLTNSVCFLSVPALSWLAFRAGLPAWVTFALSILVNTASVFIRLCVLRRTVSFPVAAYFRSVGLPVLRVVCCALLLCLLIFLLPSAAWSAIVSVAWCLAVACASVWLLGLDGSEKSLIFQGLHKVLKH